VGAYTAEAKDGVYMPLKATPQSMEWISTGDTVTGLPEGPDYLPTQVFHTGDEFYEPTVTPPAAQCVYTTFQHSDNVSHGVVTVPPVPPLPRPCPDRCRSEKDPPLATRPIHWGHATVRPCGPQVGYLFFKGLSPQASIQITMRTGFEVQVPNDSVYLPMVRAPMAYDRKALEVYFAISKQMLCAYPAEYNLAGALWAVISSIAAAVAPSLIDAVGGWVKNKIKESTKKAEAKPVVVTKTNTDRVPPPKTAPAVSGRKMVVALHNKKK